MYDRYEPRGRGSENCFNGIHTKNFDSDKTRKYLIRYVHMHVYRYVYAEMSLLAKKTAILFSNCFTDLNDVVSD